MYIGKLCEVFEIMLVTVFIFTFLILNSTVIKKEDGNCICYRLTGYSVRATVTRYKSTNRLVLLFYFYKHIIHEIVLFTYI